MPPQPKLEPEDFDPDFLNNYLRAAPPNSFNKTTREDMTKKAKTIKGFIREPLFALLVSLLSTMSEALYNTLSGSQKDKLRRRHRVPPTKPGHLTFVDHHNSQPTQFPNKAANSKVDDKPHFFGVFNVDDFEYDYDPHPVAARENHRIYKGIPYHRIETIVSVKLADEMDCCKLVTTYAGHHHQARPDRPSVFCLIVQDEGYQVIYSDPNGVVSSEITEWHDLDLLAAYVYSLYLPPSGHFLWDDTIRWVPGATATSMPTWKVKLNKQWYENGQLIFSGHGWGKRTTVFRAIDKAGNGVIIKETFRNDDEDMMKEEDMLEQVHCDGDMPGVVRMREWEEVTIGGKNRGFVDPDQSLKKIRIVLLDSGRSLLKAKSVNDLLKAVYDALEVHRTLFNKRKILHRDLSFYNILMYPEQNHSGNNVLKKAPTFVENLLQGTKSKKRVSPACLVIDFDHVARKDALGGYETLSEQLGTAMFIARSVSCGEILQAATWTYTGREMPLLEGTALDLYLRLHGTKRYEKYNDIGGSRHGGFPPIRDPHKYRHQELPEFKHRAEHDVESIYWTLVYTLLLVHPAGKPKETLVSTKSVGAWRILLTHSALNYHCGGDRRQYFFEYGLRGWKGLFFDEMEDVACLLSKISDHVLPEYAMWVGELQPDHLHEALQRLILQYLVDHRDKDIELDPTIRRPRPHPYSIWDTQTPWHYTEFGTSTVKINAGGDATGPPSAEAQRSRKGMGDVNAGPEGQDAATSNRPDGGNKTKRKREESAAKPVEGLRRSKRHKASPYMSGAQGGDEDATSAAAAALEEERPVGLRTRSRSKRNGSAGKLVETHS